jgi:phosphoribosylformimino-5-aminoimidazole carboxamide ribotide isomerase
MIVVPAIDLRGGRCVRLTQGSADLETRYDDDPVARAKAFASAGAKRLHVVDLDGAFGTGENRKVLADICAAIDVPVEFGGGVRSAGDVRDLFVAGVRQVILGTMLVEEPAAARALVEEHGDRLIAGVDARGAHVAVRGWRRLGPPARDAFICKAAAWGFTRMIFTEIARDGMGTGYDIEATAHVAALTPMRVTASGGAKTIADLKELLAGVPSNVDMAIVGRALYDGTMDLSEALALR